MELPSVQLNCDALIRPMGIELKPAPSDQQALVRPRCGEPAAGRKLEEASLELRTGDRSLDQSEPFQLPDATATVAAVEDLTKFGPRDQPEHLRLLKQTSDVACTEDGAQVNQCAGGSCDPEAAVLTHVGGKRPWPVHRHFREAGARSRRRDFDRRRSVDEPPLHSGCPMTDRRIRPCGEQGRAKLSSQVVLGAAHAIDAPMTRLQLTAFDTDSDRVE